MGLFQAFGVIIATIIVAASTMGTIKYHYQRETTDIEEKYTNRDSAEIDELYHKTYYPTDSDFALSINGNDGSYSDDIIPISTAQPNENLYIGPSDYDGDGVTDRDEINFGTNPYKPDPLPSGYIKPNDWDDDGWSNNKEEERGTQPDNPDSDGDGIIDSQDPDPLNPTIGGAIIPPTPPFGNGEDDSPPNVLLSKAACNPNLTDGTCDKDEYWHFDQIEANPNQILKFKIHIELENTSSNTQFVNLFDFLPTELLYVYYPGSAAIQINNNPIHQLTQYEDYWLEESYQALKLTIASGQSKTYTIWFNATLLTPSATNTVEVRSSSNTILASDSIAIE